MRVDRLGKLLGNKYGLLSLAIGEEEGPLYPDTYEPAFEGPESYSKPGVLPQITPVMPNIKDINAKIRNWIDELYRIPTKDYNIISECSNAEAAKPKTDVEKSAVKGYQFCKYVMLIVNWLMAKKNTASLSTIRKALTDLVDTIRENIGEGVQFMTVSDLIMFMVNRKKSKDREQEVKVQRQKAKTGFAKMMSVSINILNYMNELGGAPSVAGRFKPQPTKTLDKERDWFLMNYGDQFGIPDLATWAFAVDADPNLVPLLAKLVRTLRRPGKQTALLQAPRIKSAIQSMVRKVRLAKATNMPYLEKVDPSLFEFDESSESPAVLSHERLQQSIQQRDLEHAKKQEELKQKQIEEDRERLIRSEGTSYLLNQLLRGTL